MSQSIIFVTYALAIILPEITPSKSDHYWLDTSPYLVTSSFACCFFFEKIVTTLILILHSVPVIKTSVVCTIEQFKELLIAHYSQLSNYLYSFFISCF